MTFMPVCIGRSTGCRPTTPGAMRSTGIHALGIGASRPSSGRHTASSTLPSTPSPAGTRKRCPVRRTAPPSRTFSSLPRSTQPTRFSFSENASPSVPSSNSTISWLPTSRKPPTDTTPSPMRMTVPVSSRCSTVGSGDVWVSAARRKSYASSICGNSPASNLTCSARSVSASHTIRGSRTTRPTSPTSSTAPASIVGDTFTSSAISRPADWHTSSRTSLTTSSSRCVRAASVTREPGKSVSSRESATPSSSNVSGCAPRALAGVAISRPCRLAQRLARAPRAHCASRPRRTLPRSPRRPRSHPRYGCVARPR